MRFNLDGLDVFFPYDYIYREQYDYMLELKRAIDDKGHVLLEMPTGTGKTVCLISLITSYQFQYKQTGKLIYCTRTVPEMTKCMEEIKKVIAYRASCIGPEGEKVLALCLSSRRNMCVHDRVMEEGDRDTVDTECRKMTASWVRNRVLNNRGAMRPHIQLALEPTDGAVSAGASANNTTNSNSNSNINVDQGEQYHELCEYYENYFSEGSHAEIPQGIYSLDDLRVFGKDKKWCPYYMTRHLIHHASILVYNYQYMLDPKVANIVSKELEAESIVVFDEAHNIDNVCIEALSVNLNRRMMDSAQRSVSVLTSHVSRMKAQNDDRLRKEAQELVRGLVQQRGGAQGSATNYNANNNNSTNSSSDSNNTSNSNSRESTEVVQARLTAAADAWLSNPILSRDLLDEAVPGNIRKADHFLSFLRQIVQYLKHLFSDDHHNTNANNNNISNSGSNFSRANTSFNNGANRNNNTFNSNDNAVAPNTDDVYEKTPIAFLHHLQSETGLDRKSLKFTYLRLNMLLRTLEMTSLEDFAALSAVCNFVTLVSTYLEGFAIVYERHGHSQHASLLAEPVLQLMCLDASIAIAPVFERFQSVVITSGTLSPIDLYPRLLNFRPVSKKSLPMSTFRNCLLPLIVSRGSDQTTLSTRFEARQDEQVIRNYGQLLLSIVQTVPDGVCGFFTSYSYMELVLQKWNEMGLLTQLLQHKLLFLETKDVVETTFALDNFRRANDAGRGAVFLSVARGKVAEGIDFDRHYGRCVVLFGIPYQYTLSHTLRARLRYLRDRYQIRDHDFLTFDALRQAAQCVGRVLRSKTDYGIVILADQRYGKTDKRARLPLWIQQFLLESLVHLSADVAVDKCKVFLREMGQEIETSALRSILMSNTEVKRLQLQSQQEQNYSTNNNTSNDDNTNTNAATISDNITNGNSTVATVLKVVEKENEEEDLEHLYDAEGDAVMMAMTDHTFESPVAKRPRLSTNTGTSTAGNENMGDWQSLVDFYRSTLFTHSTNHTNSTYITKSSISDSANENNIDNNVSNGTIASDVNQRGATLLAELLESVRPSHKASASMPATYNATEHRINAASNLPESVCRESLADFHKRAVLMTAPKK